MSPLDHSLASTLDPGAVAAPDWAGNFRPALAQSHAQSCSGTWALRRIIVQARTALLSTKLEDAAKAASHLHRLLSARERAGRDRYLPALGMLEAALHAASDRLVPARALLSGLPARATDPVISALMRYLNWRLEGGEEQAMPGSVDYLHVPVCGGAIARILHLCVSAAIAFDRLQLTVSASLASAALDLARHRYGNHSVMAMLPATLLAQVAYEQGRFEEAAALLRPRTAMIWALGSLECFTRSSVLLARLALHNGQRRSAIAILREAETIGHARGWPRLVSVTSLECRRILSTLSHETARDCEPSGAVPFTHFAQCELSTRLRQLPTRGTGPTHPDTSTYQSVESRLRQASAAATDGRLDECYGLLVECLHIGAERGLRMVFVDSGYPLVVLLKGIYEALPLAHAHLVLLRPYLATLLWLAVPVVSNEPEPPAYRPLSRREIAILEMFAAGMSNKNIAQSLGIAPETVKTHAKRMFVKLDARTRAQAVARAEAIGLL